MNTRLADAQADLLSRANMNPWSTAPFDPASGEQLRRLIAEFNSAQRMWLSGFLAGSIPNAASAAIEPSAASRPIATILYGSQSGNSESIA